MMRNTFAALLFPALCLSQQPVFKSEVNLANVTAIVRSADGALLTDLNKDEFEVLEDGVPQRIQFFARETEIPLSLALIVDFSGSQDKFVHQHHRDVEKFLNAVLSSSDRAVAICFGNHIRLVSDSTSSTDLILDGLQRFAKGDRHFPQLGPDESRDLGTALYDAVYFTIDEKLKQPEERRRVMVVFSDGEENSSEHDLLDTIEKAQNEDVLVYTVRYTDPGRHHHKGELTARNKYGARVMNHMASLSGGSAFDGLETDLVEVFNQIGAELHSLYSIGYLSSNPKRDVGFRKLEIRCKRAGAVVRTKSGYYAH